MEPNDYTPPAKKSMSDEELEALVKSSQSDEAGILRAMEILSEQAKLREHEEAEFDAWVNKLESDGSPEAKRAIENAKREHDGLPPLAVVETEEETPPGSNEATEVEHVIEPEEITAELAAEAPEQQETNEFRPMSALAEIGIPSKPLEHDLAPIPSNHELDEVVDVEIELATGVAVSDFDAILKSNSSDDETELEPENFNSAINESNIPRSGAFSQFWVWSSFTSGLLPVGLGFLMASVGLHGLQAFLALLFGVVASSFVVSVAAVAGKRAGLPTLTVSRATFGVFGNLIPSSLVLLVKFLALISFALMGVQLLDQHLFSISMKNELLVSNNSPWLTWSLPVLSVLFLVSLVLVALGEKVSYRALQVFAIIGFSSSLVCFATLKLDFASLFLASENGWWKTIAVGLLLFAGLGGLWSSSGADFSSLISNRASGFKVYLFAKLGFALLPLLSGSIGILLAENFDSKSFDLVHAFDTHTLPQSIIVGFILVSFVALIVSSLASVSNGLIGLGLKLNRWITTLVVLLIALVATQTLVANGYSAWTLLSEYLPVAGAILLAWTGTFTSEVLIRRIAYHEVSLQRSYGIYRSFNWISLAGFLLATVIGFGFVTSNGPGFAWVGFLIPIFSNALYLHEAQIGLALAFLVAAVFPVLFGIRRIKRQEAEMLAIEGRRNELNNVAI